MQVIQYLFLRLAFLRAFLEFVPEVRDRLSTGLAADGNNHEIYAEDCFFKGFGLKYPQCAVWRFQRFPAFLALEL